MTEGSLEESHSLGGILGSRNAYSGKGQWPVSRIMSRSLLQCPPETPLFEAARMMAESRCSSIIIVDADQHPLGIWTERDALAADFDDAARMEVPVSSVMSHPLRMVPHDTTLEQMVLAFRSDTIRHFVVEENGLAAGIITQSDVVRHQELHSFLTLRDVGSLTRRTPLMVDGQQPVSAIARMLHAVGHEAAVVMKDNQAYGVLTERDALRLIAARAAARTGLEVCSHPIVFASRQMPLVQAHSLMEQRKIRHLVVGDEVSGVTSILSFTDILAGIEVDYTRFLRTALERQIDAVRAGEQRQRLILEATQEGFIEVDVNLKITSVNVAIQQLLGYSEKEMTGRLVTDFCHPDALAAYRAELATIPTVPQRSYNTLFRHRTGKLVPLHINGTTMWGSEGEVVGAFAFITDLSEQHRHQVQMKELLDSLSRSNAELESFAYVVSHDLQEPLRMITGYLGLLERRLGSEIGEEGHEFMGYAVDGARRMQSMIADLLEYSRVNRQGNRFTSCDLGLCVSHVVRDLLPQLSESGGQVDIESLPTLQADPLQITRLFACILQNAIQFSQPGRPLRVRISARRTAREDEWQIAVEDNGIGMESRSLERIFQVFQRLHTRENGLGNGIGLAICKRIVERHHGRIRAESVPGEGSTFLILLPDDPDTHGADTLHNPLSDW